MICICNDLKTGYILEMHSKGLRLSFIYVKTIQPKDQNNLLVTMPVLKFWRKYVGQSIDFPCTKTLHYDGYFSCPLFDLVTFVMISGEFIYT